ncbi:zinc ribbon domain-containing protein [Sinimarinibacterium sp. NLF-5-8]|uniref:NUDIX hydrolase n=1 Tax=Sinimarinibacterium sp. NLF-5-8 TaxID=2698684 RepID=UPI00137BEE78|nr:NUDIX hydrolase [Sinimarinibacterium sp. NLF-5-8]QHS08937.1 NUDIX hydrolase [Sinimarinibacterium sp. NLF-5-8]
MLPETKFCNVCGHAASARIPSGDNRLRHVCDHCGHIQYENPKVIAGVIAQASDGRVLMCRRNIAPRLGLWTFPAGFMEQGETSAQGAAREGQEESQAIIEVGSLLMVINVPYVSQIYMVHQGRLPDAMPFGPTPESSEVVLMREDEIPWEDIAFPTIWHSLKQFFADRRRGHFETHVLDLIQPSQPPLRPEVRRDDPLS